MDNNERGSCVKMKPSKVIVGLRTPQYERRLIASAATIAGIQEIHELYINGSDKLDSRPITYKVTRKGTALDE